MVARKRKAAHDVEDDWLPTVAPPPGYPGYNPNYAGSSTAAAGYGMAAVAGSSSNPILLDSPPAPSPKKRRRGAKDPDAPVPEKRGAIMKKKCPQNILDRLERVRDQRSERVAWPVCFR